MAPRASPRRSSSCPLATRPRRYGRLQVRWHDGREETVEAEGPGGSGAAIMDFPHDAHRALIGDFLDAIAEGRSPLVTGEEALATHRLIEQALQLRNELAVVQAVRHQLAAKETGLLAISVFLQQMGQALFAGLDLHLARTGLRQLLLARLQLLLGLVDQQAPGVSGNGNVVHGESSLRC
jgi:hypothetical protein